MADILIDFKKAPVILNKIKENKKVNSEMVNFFEQFYKKSLIKEISKIKPLILDAGVDYYVHTNGIVWVSLKIFFLKKSTQKRVIRQVQKEMRNLQKIFVSTYKKIAPMVKIKKEPYDTFVILSETDDKIAKMFVEGEEEYLSKVTNSMKKHGYYDDGDKPDDCVYFAVTFILDPPVMLKEANDTDDNVIERMADICQNITLNNKVLKLISQVEKLQKRGASDYEIQDFIDIESTLINKQVKKLFDLCGKLSDDLQDTVSLFLEDVFQVDAYNWNKAIQTCFRYYGYDNPISFEELGEYTFEEWLRTHDIKVFDIAMH